MEEKDFKVKVLKLVIFLSKITEELEKVKQEMEEKGSSMTDGGKAFGGLFLRFFPKYRTSQCI